VTGDDEAEALSSLVELFETNFHGKS
jgi:hypothetical protein